MIDVAPPPQPARLRGTAKQVSWALHLRSQLLPELEERRDNAANRLRFGLVDDEQARGYLAMVRAADCIARVDRADWWIAQQGRSAHTVLAEIGRRILAQESLP